MKPPAAPPPYYPALTGLRAVSAFAVFGFHHRHLQGLGSSALGGALRAVLGELHIGVSIFFTLSGFLITKRYAGRRFDGAEWRRYLLHRAARIWPVYLVLVLATFAASYPSEGRAHPGRWLSELAASLTLLKGFAEKWYLTGIPQAWSLTVEEGFYLLAPLVFWLGWRYRPGRAWPLLAVGLVALGLGVYSAVPGLGSSLFIFKATIFGRLPEFLVGAAFAWFAPCWGRGWATVGGASGMLLGLALLVGVQRVTHAVSLDSYPGVLLNNWLLPLATGWLLHGLATEPTGLARLLSTPLWQRLGRASYCFYLLHVGLLPDILKPFLSAWLPAGPALLASAAILLLASLALHRCVEQPAHRWLLARLAPARPPAASTLSSPRG
ncbi:MAG: acyltransferase family protein [Janthinobacterium lividum]